MSGVLGRDLRHALRVLRRAPGFTVPLVLGLGAGMGASLPLLGLVRAGRLEPRPYSVQAALDGVRQSDWRTGWTEVVRLPSQPRDEALAALLLILLALVGLVLLVAVLNSTILLLARATARRHEMAMRAVLGAGRRRLLGQLLVEGALLAGLAAVLGVIVGGAGVAALDALRPAGIPGALDPAVDARVLGIALGVPALCALAAALAPALPAAARDLARGLGAAGRATAGRGEGRSRDRLVVAAIASSLVLLTGAGLLVRGSLPGAASGEAGMDPRDTLLVPLDLTADGFRAPASRSAAYGSALEGVLALPGVVDTSIASPGALVGLGTEDRVHALLSDPVRPGMAVRAHYHSVGPGFFRSIGAAPVRGRGFTAADTLGAPGAVVVNEAFARIVYQLMDPVGQRLQLGRPSLKGRWYTVVGVVENVRPRGAGTAQEPVPAIYLSALQHPPRTATLAVRAAGEPRELAEEVLAALPPALAATAGEATTLEERLAEFLAPLRWFGLLFAALAAVGLALAAVGLHGVVSYGVERRTREIGVRMAVGARVRDVVGMVARDSLRLARTGVVVGIGGALCLARLLQYLYAGIRPLDPVVYGGVALLLGAVALLAAVRPALRAARVDPTVALRAE